MKKIFFIITILFTINNCRAQSTISLEEAREYMLSDEGFPENINYVKDINNRLDQFVGMWKGIYNNFEINIEFSKKLNYGEGSIKWDKLIGRIKIINLLDNSIIYSNFNIADDNSNFFGRYLQNRVYVLNFVYNVNCNDYGDIVIDRIPNSNQLKLLYEPDKGIINKVNCPNFGNYINILPNSDIILTKQ